MAVLVAACGGDDDSGGSGDSGGDGAAASGEPIILGMETSLSGSDAAFGEANRDGGQLAVDQNNEAGGVLDGQPLELQAEDDEARPEVTVGICKKFSTRAAVMLSSFSYTSIPCTEVTEGVIPQVAMIATAQALTTAGNEWIFRIAVPDTVLTLGEQQMLAFGRALMSEPRLLLLDEPSLGLAPQLITEIARHVSEFHKRGLTVLLVEQNAHMALSLADYAYVLELGEIVSEGTGEKLLNDESIQRAYLGVAS